MRRATIVDIAKLAGVSYKTVSRALNDERHVSAALRERIKQIATDLDYHPNVNAQGLNRRRNFLIGLNYERPGPSYVVELQRGALRRIEAERYRMIVLPHGEASVRQEGLVALLRTAALDGVLLAPPSCDLEPVLDALDRAAIPYGRIAPCKDPERGVCVMMDDLSAAREITEHLLALGHRDLGLILGDRTHGSSHARSEGIRQALEARGIAMDSLPSEDGDYTFESGHAAMRRLLASGVRPTAIIAQNDDMAIGAIVAAREAGLESPRDLSVVGFDSSDIGKVCWPGLTTIRQPVFEMAEAAMDGLLRVLAGEAPPPPRVLAHELIVRQSTAPPAR